MGSKVRRRRTGELRTRTGCNRCRQRRVKCPEQKPTCSMCASLGYACSYSQQLRWQPVVGFDGVTLARERPVQDCMFIQTYCLDFDGSKQRARLVACLSDAEDASPSQQSSASGHDTLFIFQNVLVQPWLSPLGLDPIESHLWQYFHGAIAPACVLDPAVNPYQDIILRIAASTGKTSPLFNIVMAISARELEMLGKRSFNALALCYHHQAVRLLRLETVKMGQGRSDQASRAQILATVMALVFLDIMSDCSTWWVVHSDFARSLVRRFRQSEEPADPDLEALFNFVGGYIVVHEVYAHTAWNASRSSGYDVPLAAMCDDVNLQTLTGCSTDFLQILADVNSLATQFAECSKLDKVNPSALLALEHQRHHLERRLHERAPIKDVNAPDVLENDLTIELKRLTGLLHLYSRLDHLGPRDPCVSQLSTRILALIPRLPTRSNIILWPLFIVATLGIGPERDADRAFVLEKLDVLQRKRQMRYIKKARDITVEVWKVRDQQELDLGIGWEILDQVAQLERISLF